MTTPTTLLLVEDDIKLANILVQYFGQHGYQAQVVHQGDRAMAAVQTHQPELVILDLMLPGKDGLSICRELRASGYLGRILILTASDDDMDQVAALEMGADDFVTKPLQPRVLLARIRMLLRREASSVEVEPAVNGSAGMGVGKSAGMAAGVISEESVDPHICRYGELELNQNHQRCCLAGEQVPLTPAEFDLLWLLATHPDEVLSRETLVQQTRGIAYDGLDRSIDNRIVSLRKKLGDNPSLPRKLITVRGKGYLFVPDHW